jgi:hypothetical protein
MSKIDKWFKAADLKSAAKDKRYTLVIWAKGGKGMSTRLWGIPIFTNEYIKNCYVKASGHTNLRKTPSLNCKSQAVVEKCDLLKLTGRFAADDRFVTWYEVCYKGKKLWLSANYIMRSSRTDDYKFFDKDGNRINPYA